MRLSIIWVGLLFYHPSKSISSGPSLPSSIEVDLLYPIPNTTHAVSSPFPVLFSVQNANLAWEFGINIDYEIYQRRHDGEKDESGSDFLEWNFPGSTLNSPPSPPTSEPFIFASNNTEELPPGNYTIFWSVARGTACTGSFYIQYTWDVEIANGTFEFEVAYGADEPDFQLSPPKGGSQGETRACPQGLAGVVYAGYNTYVPFPDSTSTTTSCPMTSGTLALLKPCDVTVNAAQASSLTKALNLTVVSSEPMTTTSSSSLTSETDSAVPSTTSPAPTDTDDGAIGREAVSASVSIAVAVLVGVSLWLL